jgi:plasmid maintenance system antidote protein VapI/Zn-dependent peptidase ImmA (M78 family)
MKLHESDFQPDWSSAPGETIGDILAERKLSVRQFARDIGRTPKQADELLNGRARITSTLAQRLEIVVGSSAAFWIKREADYRSDLARLEGERESNENWLKELPIKEMANFGWIKPSRSNELSTFLHFFDVPNLKIWRERYRNIMEMAAFRTSPSFDSNAAAVAVWLRQGEIESASIQCKPWNPELFRNMLPKVRSLTRQREPRIFLPELSKSCAECGVAVVVLRAPKGCRASGATHFVSQNKALLLLSFRYLSDDHFWFTFFHEAGHLLLHGRDAVFLEGIEPVHQEQEKEANDFAARVLIPYDFREEMLRLPVDGIQVMRFARTVGVSPGIIVGQLQHCGRFTRRQLNNLKRRFAWGFS